MRILVLLLLAAVACSAREIPVGRSDGVGADNVAVGADEDKASEEDTDKEPERPSIHLPSIPSFQIVPQIQFPGFEFPAIPIPQLPSLPQFSLPQLPSFPALPQPFRRETVFHTKTLYIQHTHRVTRHPVCVTAYVPKPACLHDHEVKDDQDDRELEGIVAAQREHEIKPTSVISELPAATRVLDNLVESEGDFDSGVDGSEIDDQVATYRRMARYLVAHPHRSGNQPEKVGSSRLPTEPLSDEQIKKSDQHVQVPHGHPINPQNHGPGVVGLQDELVNHDNHEVVNGLLRVTHLVTKTILVTNVEKVIDHKVTATLIAKNCVPSEYIIPHCDAHSDTGPNLFKDTQNVDAESEADTGVDADAKTVDVEDVDPPVNEETSDEQ